MALITSSCSPSVIDVKNGSLSSRMPTDSGTGYYSQSAIR